MTILDSESVLRNMQNLLVDAAPDADSPGWASARDAMRKIEQSYGSSASNYGRRLSELVWGSYAWNLFERPTPHDYTRPLVHELSQSESLLQAMRESGELDARETLIEQRDQALADLWQSKSQSVDMRWLTATNIYDRYFVDVRILARQYRSYYKMMRKAAENATPLALPKTRSRVLIMPPVMSLLFRVCHRADITLLDLSSITTQQVFKGADNSIILDVAGKENLSSDLLDEMAWDVATVAVSTFFVRTPGNDSSDSFSLLVDDYFEWRNLDPRNRTPELRKQAALRIDYLCSENLIVKSSVDLWMPDPDTGERRRQSASTTGTLLIKRGRFFRHPSKPGEIGQDSADGYVISLGDWAKPFVRSRAMRGVCLRKLAEYNLQRQQWERRIGWYLTFQMNNQAAHMTISDSVVDGKARSSITPQHPLKMRTVLENSCVPWLSLAETNPAKVIKNWIDAIETLRSDGIIGPYVCMDGEADGSDLPVRGRLKTMLERRYQFVPGWDVMPHVVSKLKRAAKS